MKNKVTFITLILICVTFSLGFAQNDSIKVIGTSAKLGSSDNNVTIHLRNSQPIMGLELTLLYPLGLEVTQIDLISRASEMSLEEDNPLGQLKLIIYGFGEIITVGEGGVIEVSFDVAVNASPGFYSLNLDNVIASNSFAENVEILPVSGTFVIEDIVIPVELATFKASYVQERQIVELAWQTCSETNNYGFEIQRSSSEGDFEDIGFVNGNGTTNSPQSYIFRDDDLSQKSYNYRLKQIDFDGTFSYSQTITVQIASPKLYRLVQNYPNPFSLSTASKQTSIKFQLPQHEKVEIKIFNILGREVKSLLSKPVTAGDHLIYWDGMDNSGLPVSAGIYYYQMKTADYKTSKKMLIIE